MDSEQQFSLSWNNFHGNVSRELSEMLGSGTLADVTLAVDGRLLQAHRLVLAICSPYFKTIFETNPHHHPIVVLRDVSHAAMCSLLQFMYHGEVSVRREDLNGFIATAELLQIKGLTNKETDEERNRESPKSVQDHNSQRRPYKRIATSPEDSNTAEIKRKMLNENIQRLNHLKRTSEQFLHNFYQMDPQEKLLISQTHSIYDEAPTDESYMDKSQENEHSNDYNVVDLKTECDDDDIVIADPAIQEKFQDRSSDACSKELIMANHNRVVRAPTSDPPSLPAPYNYIFSRKGHKQLVHMNFVYTKHSTTHGKTSWRCVQYFTLNRCPATVETVDHLLHAVHHAHNHEHCLHKILQNNVYESTGEQ